MLPLAVLSSRARSASQRTRIQARHPALFLRYFPAPGFVSLNGLSFYLEALLLGLFFLLPRPLHAQSDVRASHAHTICANCHLSEGASGGANTGERKIRACVDCHRKILLPSDSATRGSHAISGHALDSSSGGKTAPLGGTTFEHLECLTCHIAHYHGEPKLLRLNEKAAEAVSGGGHLDLTSQLCVSCHPLGGEFKSPGRGYVRHPVGIPVTKIGGLDRSQLPPLVDVKGTPDPSDDVIGCMTCHEVHASRNSFILRWGGAELSAACLKCHPEVAPSGPGNLDSFMVRR